MSINLYLPENVILKPCITVFGVGGGGCNAVNNMIAAGLQGAKFVISNTDAQALEHSKAEIKLQLGESVTKGLGAGAAPDVGKAAAEEAMEQITEHLAGSNMVFITAGMGGGTGTGAAPVIAKVAREMGMLTVGVVTKPFQFEGAHRMRLAESGLAELEKYVDTLIVIPNQNLFRIANEKTTFADAFKMADDVLRDGVRGVTDLMIMPGLINLDFADIKSVMSEMGKAMMGTGEAEGENRAIVAAEAAISNPLLDHSSMKGARGVLINITGGDDMTLFEVDEAANRIREEVDPDANIIFGSAFNEKLKGKIRVSVVATGIDAPSYGSTLKHDAKYSIGLKPAPIKKYDEPVEKFSNSDIDEFAKKNIPSYPNRKEEEVLKSYDEDLFSYNAVEPKEDSFIPPAPNIPQEKPTESYSPRATRSGKYDEAPAEKEGFFSSLFKKTAPRASTPAVSRPSSTRIGEEPHLLDDSELITEDVISVPAFQRRNNE